MSAKLGTILEGFHAAILDKNAEEFVPQVKPNPKISPHAQMNIYIEGYRLRLVAAIRADYPELLALLGEQAFDALALAFTEKNPPTHFSLDRYPHAFASFIHAHQDDAFASDLAALECAIADVFMMEDSEPLSPQALAGITPENFGEMVIAPRAASLLLAFDYPVENYFVSARAGEKPSPPAPEKTTMFMLRHLNEVRRHPLSHAEYLLLSELFSGKPIGVAIGSVANHNADLLPEIASHLQNWFARWTENGFFKAQS